MQEVIIEKHKLLVKIKENREKHKATYEGALEGWQNRVIEELQAALEDAKAGRKFNTFFNLPEPEDHTSEYDAVIEQIEWNEEAYITLDFHQFNQFVRDDWGWKKDFVANTMLYSGFTKK